MRCFTPACTSSTSLAARATRSARGAASTTSDDDSRCLLLALSHDELGVIVDGLADPLQPVVAVALSSTCLGLRTPLRAALEVLLQRHERAVTLCRMVGGVSMTCLTLRDAETLDWSSKSLTVDDLATLGILLPWMPRLMDCDLGESSVFGDEGIHALCERLGPGAPPSLTELGIGDSRIGLAGAEALAAALRRGAMPKLRNLHLACNPELGGQGATALSTVLKESPVLECLDLGTCGIDDEGVASLVANLGKDDFKALKTLRLDKNDLTDVGCAKLVAALRAGALPAIGELYYKYPMDQSESRISMHASQEACEAVDAGLQQRLE